MWCLRWGHSSLLLGWVLQSNVYMLGSVGSVIINAQSQIFHWKNRPLFSGFVVWHPMSGSHVYYQHLPNSSGRNAIISVSKPILVYIYRRVGGVRHDLCRAKWLVWYQVLTSRRTVAQLAFYSLGWWILLHNFNRPCYGCSTMNPLYSTGEFTDRAGWHLQEGHHVHLVSKGLFCLDALWSIHHEI